MDADGGIEAAAFALSLSDQTAFDILDIEFLDDSEVMLLLRLPEEGSICE